MSTFAKQDPPMPPQQYQQGYAQPQQNQPYPPAAQQQPAQAPPQYAPAPSAPYPQQQQQQQQGYYPQQQQQNQYPPDQYQQQPQQYQQPVYGQPVMAPAVVVAPIQKSNWTTGVCDCFEDCGSCCEVMWCSSCQSSSQWNRVDNGKQGIEPLVCLAVFGGDCCLGGIGTPIVAILLRQRLRTRYNLEGTDCNDVVCGCCCAGCVLCQNYREMCVRGEHPGGVCCTSAPYVGPARVQ